LRTAIALNNTSAKISWAPPKQGGDLNSYVVQSSADSGATWTNRAEIKKSKSSQYSVTISGLAKGTNYLFRIFSKGDSAESAPSLALPIRTLSLEAPDVLANLQVTRFMDYKIISWSASKTTADNVSAFPISNGLPTTKACGSEPRNRLVLLCKSSEN
jgi:hypothetical protein